MSHIAAASQAKGVETVWAFVVFDINSRCKGSDFNRIMQTLRCFY